MKTGKNTLKNKSVPWKWIETEQRAIRSNLRTRQLQNPDSVLHHVSDVCHIFIVYGFKFDNITGCGAGN